MNVKLSQRQISRFSDLTRILGKTIHSTWGQDKILFSSAYPKIADIKSIPTPIITYRIDDKSPGDFNSTKEIKPRLREEITSNDVDPELRGKALEVWGQMFDYIIEFEIWAENALEADQVAEDFQEFMFKYTGYFKKLGVSEILFLNMNSNKVNSNKWRTDLINRSIYYFIRIDEVVGIKCPVIENIELEVRAISEEFLKNFIILHGYVVPNSPADEESELPTTLKG